MGSYEEQYRNYYSDTKAKLKIKTETKKSSIKNKKVFNKDLLEDLYPKINYKNSNDEIYNEDYEKIYESKEYEDKSYMLDEYGKDKYMNKDNKSRNIEKSTSRIDEISYGTYRGLESYSGINSYNNTNNTRGFEVYNGSAYYGQLAGKNSNVIAPVNNFMGSLVNRFIIKIALTVALFIFVVGIKYSPYEKTRDIYTSFKVAVDKDFKYEDFIGNVKTIDVIRKVNEFKESLQIKPDDINTLN